MKIIQIHRDSRVCVIFLWCEATLYKNGSQLQKISLQVCAARTYILPTSALPNNRCSPSREPKIIVVSSQFQGLYSSCERTVNLSSRFIFPMLWRRRFSWYGMGFEQSGDLLVLKRTDREWGWNGSQLISSSIVIGKFFKLAVMLVLCIREAANFGILFTCRSHSRTSAIWHQWEYSLVRLESTNPCPSTILRLRISKRRQALGFLRNNWLESYPWWWKIWGCRTFYGGREYSRRAKIHALA